MAYHWIPVDAVEHEPSEDCVCGPTERESDWVHYPIDRGPHLSRWASLWVVLWNHRHGWTWEEAGLGRWVARMFAFDERERPLNAEPPSPVEV